jgi:protein tyrosine phosphatase (PTP) superfamily phosphohydrolase (DUF442 family)
VAALGLALYLVVGNLLILGASGLMQLAGPDGVRPANVEGVDHLRVVDDRLWRGGEPTEEGYQSLAANGVTTIVDLRASTSQAELEAVQALGFEVVHLPLDDGQVPGPELIHRLVDVVERSPGRVFVHCQAGVGRTGSVVAAYRVWMGQASPGTTLTDNLAIGPPTLEQLAFTAGLSPGEADGPPMPIVVASRVLDAPRQLWNRVFG